MKKICMVVPSFTAKGGIAAVVSGYRNSELEKRYSIKYIESYCDGGKISKTLKAITAYFIFMKELIFNKPDLVHIHSSFGGSFYRKLPFVYMASTFKIPIINHIHGSEISNLYVNSRKVKKKIVEDCFNKCTYLIILSQEWEEKIKVVKTFTPRMVIENYSIIHKECLEKKRMFRKKKNDVKKILFLGFITELKGCFDIPDIAEKIISKYKNIKFILAGSGEIEKLRDKLKNKNIEKYFLFTGWVKSKEKEKLLESSDIFFLPSYTEAMPMSILEAMGYGLPIIASDTGGIPQLVKEGINGFMAKPGDIDIFSKKILFLLENEKLCNQMGKESIKIADNNYSLERHIEKICFLYRKVLVGE